MNRIIVRISLRPNFWLLPYVWWNRYVYHIRRSHPLRNEAAWGHRLVWLFFDCEVAFLPKTPTGTQMEAHSTSQKHTLQKIQGTPAQNRKMELMVTTIETAVLTNKLLQEAIARVAGHYPVDRKGREGYGCEFCLALSMALRQRGIEHKLRLGLRTETRLEDEEAVPNTIFSHASLYALESTWDEGGPEAQARWEAHWPYSDRIRCRFSWKNIRRAEADIPSINNLILSYGGDPLDEGLLSLFLKTFQEALPVKCEAYKEPPEPAVIPSESDLAEAAKLA
jgi:hypothetical protein